MRTDEKLKPIVGGVVNTFKSVYGDSLSLFSVPMQLALLKAQVLEWAFIWLEMDMPLTIEEAQRIYDLACDKAGLYWELDGCIRRPEHTRLKLEAIEEKLAERFNLKKDLNVEDRRQALIDLSQANKMHEDELVREWEEIYSAYLHHLENEQNG